jgi:hypothetical protein
VCYQFNFIAKRICRSLLADVIFPNPAARHRRGGIPEPRLIRRIECLASGGSRSFSSSADEFRPSYSSIGLLASIAHLRFARHFRQ